MNIGIFTDTFHPQINGVVTSVKTLQKELTKRGHKVYIFTTSDPSIKTKDPNIIRLKSIPFPPLPTARVALWYPPKLLLSFKKFKLDVIHLQTEFAVGIFGKAISEFLKIPCVHTYHTMYEDYVHYIAKGRIITKRIAKQFSRVFCNRADLVIAPSEKTFEALTKYGVVRPIEIVPTGIDFKPFRKTSYTQKEVDDIKLEIGVDLDCPIILFVGRIAQEKSIDVILKEFSNILNKIPNAKFVIIGDGPYKKQLEELTNELKLNESVIFAGAKPWSEIGKFYQIGDVYVTASTSETQGLTYLEAMSAGLPLIAKNDDVISSIIIHKETGFLFDAPNELTNIVFEVLTDKILYDEVVKNGYEAIDHFSSENFALKLEEVYKKVIEQKRKKGIFLFLAKSNLMNTM